MEVACIVLFIKNSTGAGYTMRDQQYVYTLSKYARVQHSHFTKGNTALQWQTHLFTSSNNYEKKNSSSAYLWTKTVYQRKVRFCHIAEQT